MIKSKRAFTLVELLVVISIILIASSVIFLGSGGGDGAKLSSAQRIVSGIAQGARGQAILKNADARLIIYSEANTSGDPDKFLRYFGIVYRDEDETGASGWRAATQGTYLPEGIYFNPDLSSTNDWPSGSTMPLDFPRSTVQTGGSETYYYYEFMSNGTMASDFQNAWLVLQAGTLRPLGSDNNFEIDFDEEENELLKTALIFRRAGTTTPVNEPGDID